jgi:hypothetical protein
MRQPLPPKPGFLSPPSPEPGWLLVIVGAVVVTLAQAFLL